MSGPSHGNYESFKSDARLVHNFICATRQTLPHCFEPEVLGVMSVMDTLAGKWQNITVLNIHSNYFAKQLLF